MSPQLLAFGAAALAAAGLSHLLPEPRRRQGSRAARLLRLLGARLSAGTHAPRDLAARIAAAGAPGGLGERELMAGKLAGALLGAVAGLPVSAVAPGRLGILLIACGPVVGFLAPDLWLARRAAERFRAVRRDLPALLDLLQVTVESGLALAAALAAVGERTAGPLAREWRVVGREVGLGVPLREALAAMAGRLPMPEVRALVAALERASRHGAPLADTLAAQARDARLSRRRQIQEEAARAGPKIQLVVALLLVPSVLLLVAAALAAALLGSGDGVAVG